MPMDYDTTDRAELRRYASDGPVVEAPVSNLRQFENRLDELQMSLDDLVSTVRTHADRTFGMQGPATLSSTEGTKEPTMDQRLYRIETAVQTLRSQINRF
jgi:hypothetical protein